MRLNRILSFLLALSSLLLTASCASSDPTDPNKAASSDTTAADSPQTEAVTGIASLPDNDLSGFELHIAKQTQENIAWANVAFAVAEENGEVLNDAIHKRNIAMMEKYNFEMSETELDDPLTALKKQNLAGDSEHDLFLISLNKVNAISNADNLIDFHSVPNLELTGAWWDQDMLRDLDIGGSQYFMNGDVIFSVYDCLLVIMYNKNYAEDLGLTGFYDLVNDGKWTIDTMYQMMRQASADANSDGKMDYQDVYGLDFGGNAYMALTTAQNVKLIDSKGNLGVFTDKFVSVYENVVKLVDKNIAYNYANTYPGLTTRQGIVTMFDNKQVLFFLNGMSAAAQYLRDLKNVDFGFLPIPKYDEAQERYYSGVTPSAPVLCIPVTTAGDRLDATGFALEALCRESSQTVVPEYFETCFSAKYTHDAESYDMILLATESRMYDPGDIFNFGKIQTTVITTAKAGDMAIVSKLESIREAVIAEFNANYEVNQ